MYCNMHPKVGERVLTYPSIKPKKTGTQPVVERVGYIKLVDGALFIIGFSHKHGTLALNRAEFDTFGELNTVNKKALVEAGIIKG